MLILRTKTSDRWLQAVMRDFESFLQDHAACERKASASALALVSHFWDRTLLVREMISVAREELQHFEAVAMLLLDRGRTLGADTRDPYVGALRALVRQGPEVHLLDRLLIGGVVEARGAERFGLITGALPAGELKSFYGQIARSEVRHQGVFLRLAEHYFPADVVRERLETILDQEVQIVGGLEIRSALH
jgi:tRNA-(ms[2]io[6]A)-hydroxylase